ncbi:hypothetical protein [Lactobacillus corticis]
MFKVVMPEANRVTMPAEEYKEQPEYLVTFANFYISEFTRHDLEVMNLYDSNNNMMDINHYLIDNLSFSRKALIKHVLQNHDHNFMAILDKIKQDSGVDPETMASYEDWQNWYEKRRSEIQGSLS